MLSLFSARAISFLRHILVLCALLLWAFPETSFAHSDTHESELSPQRQYQMLKLAIQEYGESVQGGVVVDAGELAVTEAILTELEEGAPSEELTKIRSLVAERAEVKRLEEVFAEWLEAHGAGIVSEKPERTPSIAVGRKLFARYCTSCHGEQGDGQGPLAAEIEDPKPANFIDVEFMQNETPEEFFQVLSIGVPGSAMPPWDEVLTAQERWDTVAFLWSLASGASADPAEFNRCSSCHTQERATAAFDLSDAGLTQRLAAIEAHRANATETARLARQIAFVAQREGDDQVQAFDTHHMFLALDLLLQEYKDAVQSGEVANKIEYGETRLFLGTLQGDIEAGFSVGKLQNAEISDLVKEVGEMIYAKREPNEVEMRAAELRQLLQADLGIEKEEKGSAVERVIQILEEARSQAEASPDQAASKVLSAYMAFEAVEKKLITIDQSFGKALEAQFVALRAKVSKRQDASAEFEKIRTDLQKAEELLAGKTGFVGSLIASLLIILREGLEAILVISALAAYLLKGGHLAARRWLFEGALGGVVASFVTAGIFEFALRNVGMAKEALEGVTMLLAAVILFFVSYWLLSRISAQRWQAYIQKQLNHALGSGSRFAMVSVAFLAVYREGFETVLFYRALMGGASSTGAVLLGLVLGCLALVVVWIGVLRFSMKIPLRPFFACTGALLYVLALRFVGGGIVELQEAGWIHATPVSWWPGFSWLGMASNLETALAQLLLIVAALVAFAVIAFKPAAPQKQA